ncbi:hypothetical protein [Paludisphaera sp.]|uniref:hypothetical protein n=1 Tax=Paludisphaera sp. TaxID=2017432 RepID=UPI00301B96F2
MDSTRARLEVMTGEQFARDLRARPTSGTCAVTGAAKLSDVDGDGEILFTQDTGGNSWERIPVKMIESVEQMGQIVVRGEQCRHVRLTLKAPPASEEVGVLTRLLSQRNGATAQAGGESQRAGDGVLPLRVILFNGGTLPLSLILHENGGTLPLWAGDGMIIMGWRVGN